jgi:hypothetical protein
MPNTLAHIGIQAIVPGMLAGNRYPADLVFLGCIIPDLPWIMRRVIQAASIVTDEYLLFAYASSLSSLASCLTLALAVAMIYRKTMFAWIIIGTGCLVHLVLDALQIKWGNGVLFLAPFDWRLTSIGVIWPDHFTNYVATLAGLGVVIWFIRRFGLSPMRLPIKPGRMLAVGMLLILYFLAPAATVDASISNDNHYLSTLRNQASRPGKLVEIDRNPVYFQDDTWVVELFTGERIRLANFAPDSSGLYSLRGQFNSSDELLVHDWHRGSQYRDTASIAGIFLIVAWLVRSLQYRVRKTDESAQRPHSRRSQPK